MKLPVWTTTTKPSFTLISQAEETIPSKQWVSVGVTFGDPRRNCSGSGICKIMATKQIKRLGCQGTRINGFLNLVDGRHLQVIFDQRQLSSQQKKHCLTGTKMLLRADLSLPLEVTIALGLSEKAILSPGEYLIYQDGHYLYHYVRFRNLFRRI
jgi:hypothetical protein